MEVIYLLVGLTIIAAPIVFISLYVNQKQKKKRQLRLGLVTYLFFVSLHLGISSDDDARIEAAEAVSYDFMSCISYIETAQDMDTCFEELADNAESYSEQYQE